ncbi:hypothetical protein SAMN04515647_3004 [Cohaesibacter sp. ES.047]|nr:hypothetical protein SAMN04515647_3004 [Cohaesibacter sp. ES.047]
MYLHVQDATKRRDKALGRLSTWEVGVALFADFSNDTPNSKICQAPSLKQDACLRTYRTKGAIDSDRYHKASLCPACSSYRPSTSFLLHAKNQIDPLRRCGGKKDRLFTHMIAFRPRVTRSQSAWLPVYERILTGEYKNG